MGHRLYLGGTSHPCKCLLVHDDGNLMYWCPELLRGTKQWVLGPQAASWQSSSSVCLLVRDDGNLMLLMYRCP